MRLPSQERVVVRVVDDDEAVRDSLECLLSSVAFGVETYASCSEFLHRWNPAYPGCLVLDLRMPGMSGLELQHTLEDQGVEIPIVFISGHGDIPSAVKAMRSGATEFLTKPFSEQELLDSVQRAVAEDSRRRSELAGRSAVSARIQDLTPRERDILDCVVEGQTNKEIAETLHISPKTVEMHRSRVLQKMRAKSAVELVHQYLTVYPERRGRVRH